MLGIVKHLHLGALQPAAEIYVGLLAATILFIATNAGIIGVSRLVYSMGLHRQLPDRPAPAAPALSHAVDRDHPVRRVACITLIPGQATFLGNMYAFGAMLSFTIAHISVIRLRTIDPNRERPYRGPGNIRIAGRELLLFAIVGGLGTFLAFVTVTALHLDVAAAGVAWLLTGIAVYASYRRNQGLDLTSTVKVAIPRSVVDHEAEYESVLVAFDERGHSPDVMATAARLAARRRRGIHVLVTISVPATSPINAALPELESAAQTIIEEAKVQAGRRVSGHWEKVRAGQAAWAIIEEARAMDARAIVMPLASKGGPSPFGRTLETVLRERPCRVILELAPLQPVQGPRTAA